jgi:D-glycero-D-manno-heptose 1,7-bisphosphate phosphatase
VVIADRRRAAFLDRDGVLNRAEVRDFKPYSPRRLRDFILLPGVPDAVARLKQAGLLVVVVTNQPDIGNGFVTESVMMQMHARLRARVPVDDIRMCPHSQTDGCDCRKPKPGMLLAAAADYGIDLKASFMVGDRFSDMLAGAAAGCYTIFLRRGYAESRNRRVEADAVVRSFPEATRLILSRLERGL